MLYMNGKGKKIVAWSSILTGALVAITFISEVEAVLHVFGLLWDLLHASHADHAIAAIVTLSTLVILIVLFFVFISGLKNLKNAIFATEKRADEGRKKIHDRLDRDRVELMKWRGATDARLDNIENYQRSDTAIAKLAERESR